MADLSGILTDVVKPENPLTTMGAWANLASTQANTERTRVGIDQDKQKLHVSRVGAIGGYATSLAMNTPDEQMTPDFAKSQVQKVIQMGLATPEEVAPFLQDISPNSTPAELKQKLMRIGMATVHPEIAQRMATPDRNWVDTGQQIVPVNTPKAGMPGANVPTPAGPGIQTQMSPAQGNQLQKVWNPNTKTYDYVPLYAVPGVTPTGTGTGAPTVGGGGQPGPYRYTPPGAAKPAAGAPASPAPTTTTAAPAQAEPPPGYVAGTTATVQQNTAMANGLIGSNEQRPQRVAMLNDMETQLPDIVAGPDAEKWLTVKNRLAQLGWSTSGAVDSASKTEQFMKMATNFQAAQMSAMGGLRTNEGLQQSIAGTPHIAMSKTGLQAVIHQLKGNEDAQDIMAREWQASGAEPGDFNKWRDGFTGKQKDGAQFDPRAFWLSHMTRDERNEFVKNTKDKDQLEKNYNYAVSKGWVR